MHLITVVRSRSCDCHARATPPVRHGPVDWDTSHCFLCSHLSQLCNLLGLNYSKRQHKYCTWWTTQLIHHWVIVMHCAWAPCTPALKSPPEERSKRCSDVHARDWALHAHQNWVWNVSESKDVSSDQSLRTGGWHEFLHACRPPEYVQDAHDLMRLLWSSFCFRMLILLFIRWFHPWDRWTQFIQRVEPAASVSDSSGNLDSSIWDFKELTMEAKSCTELSLEAKATDLTQITCEITICHAIQCLQSPFYFITCK